MTASFYDSITFILAYFDPEEDWGDALRSEHTEKVGTREDESMGRTQPKMTTTYMPSSICVKIRFVDPNYQCP